MTPITAVEIERILSRHDPAGLVSDRNTADEYLPEAETIAPRLPKARTKGDVRRILHDEFTVWLGPGNAPPAADLAAAADEVWKAMNAD